MRHYSTKQPNRFVSFVHALLLLTLMTAVTAESPIMNGVHFQKEASIIFSDSEWIISTDVKFKDIHSNLKFLRQKMTSPEKKPNPINTREGQWTLAAIY